MYFWTIGVSLIFILYNETTNIVLSCTVKLVYKRLTHTLIFTDKDDWWVDIFLIIYTCKGERLVKSMAPLFAGAVVEPCLLHGDLWSGNISSDKNGDPVILDPACYCEILFAVYGLFFRMLDWIFFVYGVIDGHNEAEFGMSWCAGFGGSFYDAYFEVPYLRLDTTFIRCFKTNYPSDECGDVCVSGDA